MLNSQQPYSDANAVASNGRVVTVDAHAREDAVRVLQRGGMSSVKSAFYLTAGLITAGGVVGGALAGFGAKNWLFLVLGAIPFVWFVCWIVCDWVRLHEHARALQRVLDTEKQYELLVDDARRERDQVKLDRDRLSAQVAMLTVGADLVRAITQKTSSGETE